MQRLAQPVVDRAQESGRVGASVPSRVDAPLMPDRLDDRVVTHPVGDAAMPLVLAGMQRSNQWNACRRDAGIGRPLDSSARIGKTRSSADRLRRINAAIALTQ